MRDNNYIIGINDKIVIFSKWIINHYLIVIIVCLVISIGGVFFTLQIRTDNTLEAYFMDNDPSYSYWLNFMEEFGNDEILYILYRTAKGIFNLDILQKTQKLVEDLEEIPYVLSVNAITNIEFMEGNKNGDLMVYNFMDKFPTHQIEADSLMHKLMDKPLYLNNYISADANFAAIVCDIEDRPENDPTYHMIIGDNLKKILSKREYKDFEFWPVGQPVLNFEINRTIEEETFLLVILGSLLVFGLLYVFSQEVKGIIGPLAVVIFSLLLVTGFMGIMDYPITTMFPLIPSLLIAIGVADAVHIITEYQTHLAAGYNNQRSILAAVRMVGFPCLFTSITTAVGFGALTISPLRAVREYGWYTVIGVLAIFIFSFTILLVILSFTGKKTDSLLYSKKRLIEIEKQKGYKFIDWILQLVVYLNIKYYKATLAILSIITIIAIYGTSRLQVNTSWLGQFGDKMKVYQDHKFVDRIMGGTLNLNILLSSNIEDGVKTYQFVHTLEKIQNYAIKQDYLVKKTFSIVDIVKDVNRSLHNNDKSFYRIPNLDEEVSQYLLLYEISGGEGLEKLVSAEIASARLILYVESSDTITAKRFYDDLVRYIESVKPTNYDYKITGATYMILEAVRGTVETQINSIILALALISVMMIIAFRSLKVGLISMIPNVFPVLFILGFMGITEIWLDSTRVTFACIAVGLAVDDTIHFMSRYRLEFDQLGNYNKALNSAMIAVGPAITITTIILVIGFGSAMVSQMNNIFYFGMLLSMTIFIALVVDYLIAPALILVFKPFGKEFDPEE